METEETNTQNPPETPENKPGSREQYLARMRERLGEETDLETDPETRYSAFLKYDDEQQTALNGFRDSNKKLADTFSKNPRFAAMLSDVMKGEDPSTAFVKYFGKDALEASGDEEKMKIITQANQEYLNRVTESEQLRKTQEQNLQQSESEMTAFQAEKKLTDEDFAKFIDEIYNVLERGLEGLIQNDFLQIFWKGLNYDTDIQEAATTGEIEGRNQKIELENRAQKNSGIPNLNGSNLTKGGKSAPPPPSPKRDFFEQFPTE